MLSSSLPDGLIDHENAEELLAMKVLSMTDTRLQDRIDAQHLLQFTPKLDINRVREHRARITSRGYAGEQDLEAMWSAISLRATAIGATVTQ